MAVTTQSAPRRAGIYLRISDTDDELGVRRHEAICRKMADDLGWIVSDTYTDNSRSAWSRKPRPSYLRMMDDLRAGTIDAVLAFAADRLHRNSEEHIGFLRLAGETGFICHTSVGGPLDFATAGGQLLSKVQADIAEYESQVKSERQKAKMAELREAGKTQGGRRPFGLTDGRKELDPKEAALLREAATNLLAGQKMYQIVTAWNADGITTVAGKPWSVTKLKTVLLGAWTRGFTPDGTPAQWPTIIDEVTGRRLDLLLNDPARKQKRPETVRHLLSGLLICGKCGAGMGAVSNNGKRAYGCRECFGTRITTHIEDDLRDRVFARMDPSRVIEPDTMDAEDERAQIELDGIQRELDQLTDMLGAGDIDRAGFRRAKGRIDARAEIVRDRMRSSAADAHRREMRAHAAALSKNWPKMTTESRRAIIEVFVASVTIGAGVRGRHTYDPERVHVNWL